MVVSAITLEALALLSTWQPESCLEAVQISVARMTKLADKYCFLKNENQVTLFVFNKGN